jgi:prevent-host-death family protein
MVSMKWQIHKAKTRFGQMLAHTLRGSPQMVVRQGKPVAVLISVDEYRRLCTSAKTFNALLASAPLQGTEIKGRSTQNRTCD